MTIPDNLLDRGRHWDFCFGDLAIFSLFCFSHLKNAVFSFVVLRTFSLIQSLSSSFCQQWWQFADSSVICILWFFLVLLRKLHPALIPSGHLIYSLVPRLSFRGMHEKPSLFSSWYFGSKGLRADYEKLKITSKQKTSSQISHISSLATSQRLTSAGSKINNCAVISHGRHASKPIMIPVWITKHDQLLKGVKLHLLMSLSLFALFPFQATWTTAIAAAKAVSVTK